jgi:DNA-binding NarL/FixJ family response regulator
MKGLKPVADREDKGKALSGREKQIMMLAAGGYTIEEIAEQLFISPPTVETHRSNILKKLRVSNMTEAVAYALRNKIIE